MTVQFVIAVAAFLIIRLLPLWASHLRGPDSFYYLLCVEEFRKHRRIPIRLPDYFLLEDADQSYPPGFIVFLSWFPSQLLKKYFWVVNHLVDLTIGLGVWAGGLYLGGEYAAWVGLLLYASSPFIFNEYQVMTSRPLASVLFFAFVGCAWAGVMHSPWMFVPAILVGVLLVFTHKLTMQLCWFLFPFLSLWRGEWAWVLLLVGAYALAFAVGRRFFLDLVDGHGQYIRFWHRNSSRLGAHQVKQSPVYGDPSRQDYLFHVGTGWRQVVRNIRRLLICNPWIVPGVLAGCMIEGPLVSFMTTAIIGVFFFSLATLVVPWLRGIGDGTKYVKYVLPPTLVLTSVGALGGNPAIIGLCLLIGVWHVYHWFVAVRELNDKGNPLGEISRSLESIVEYLRELPAARIMSIPSHNSDYLAYSTRKSIFQGGHSSGVDRIEPWFPVFLEPVEVLADKNRLSHLLINADYATLEELRLEGQVELIMESGPFALYSFER